MVRKKKPTCCLNGWISLQKNENDFQFDNYEINELKPFVNWKATGWWASNTQQPEGKVISFSYTHHDEPD